METYYVFLWLGASNKVPKELLLLCIDTTIHSLDKVAFFAQKPSGIRTGLEMSKENSFETLSESLVSKLLRTA